ncbi:3-hydroxybutyryl-CoA dehydratase [Oceanobacillus picturae]|uniref:3-hydroxybutyryl-CoA dehydratase n=1 Tax=Oceanobacillus picturae TaxID=171693 RepID=W9B634_9BACI|nr:enoyl-CoA hydratase [Oceanobacillus picturae]RIU96246.1 enoyl-CoA hydratase [Oceanobacillus picturae]GAQ17378.1 3-hydroxybutyryl-CoA dehydratase [Oceanobacillus picturae]CDO02110.1 putative enoyl-CoA hydratase echA8 [Oceanobacillus picturae]
MRGTTYRLLSDSIAIITLNRPNAANALSKVLLDELNEYIYEINQSTTIRCLIITGAGNKAFCAGADLKERKEMSEDQVVQAVHYIGKTITALENVRIPVIAAINGAAFGGGLELALACDIRIASNQTRIGLTETTLAIIPGAGGTQRLPRLIGPGQAKRLIYTGKPISTEEAYTLGLVEELTSPDDVVERATEMAIKIASNGPVAIRQAKFAIDSGLQTDLTTGLKLEHLAYKETIPTKDRIEGLAAFKEKRKPIYKGN